MILTVFLPFNRQYIRQYTRICRHVTSLLIYTLLLK